MSKNTSQSTQSNDTPARVTVEMFSSTNSGAFLVDWIEIDSPTGFFVVGPGHIDTISILKPGGTLVYHSSDKGQASLTVPGGLAIIQNNVVKLLLFSPHNTSRAED